MVQRKCHGSTILRHPSAVRLGSGTEVLKAHRLTALSARSSNRPESSTLHHRTETLPGRPMCLIGQQLLQKQTVSQQIGA